MAEDGREHTVLALQARWDRIRIANLYDTLDKMGYGDQCIDLGIRPLFPHQHLAGKAVTCRGGRDPRTHDEIRADAEKQQSTATLVGVRDLVFPGAVVVIDGGGEPWAGKYGEMTSWNLQQSGVKGIVIDGLIRDLLGLEVIPDYTVCARGTSPIESAGRWRIHETNVAIGMPGTLTSQVRVSPGDWVVGGPDGVIIVPQEISMEALVKVEAIEEKEQGMRADLASGMSFADCYKKWGRA